MNRSVPKRARYLVIAVAAALPLLAQAKSGEFTFVVGEVSLVKAGGQRSNPVRGTQVDAGDRVVTGANGMVQLTMVDNARLSLRPKTEFVIEQYGKSASGEEGGLLNLIKGTLRTFTGAISQANRDRFIMKTRVATVGIRGSGNILYACEGEECDASVTGGQPAQGALTVNHTIEGAHAVTNVLGGVPGLPAQQGGAQTVITGPGQTALVAGNQPPRYIPTPTFIAESATTMTGGAKPADAPAASSAASAGETRNFAPGDTPALPPAQQTNAPTVGTTLGFTTIDATGNLAGDPIALHDIIIASGSAFLGQAVRNDISLTGNDLRGYRAYAGTQSGIQPSIAGGVLREGNTLVVEGANILYGRWENASLGFFGAGSETLLPGSIHWIVAPSGYPSYLSDVLTGVATYTLAGATSPTNQDNLAGVFGGQAVLNVNFTNRTLGLQASVTMPAQGASPAGSWQMTAENVPISLNSFYGSTSDSLVITNNSGQSSTGNADLTGSFEGSFVGTGLGAAILGYGISDITSADPARWQFITGVAVFSGARQDGAVPYREGRISDPLGTLPDFVRSYATTNSPGDIVGDAEGRITAFSAPFARTGGISRYAIGTAQVLQQGLDPETGLVWGRWGNGVATVTRGGAVDQLFLTGSSLHYIFAGAQSGPVSLPLTGTGVYDVIGSTSPTGFNGAVGTLNSATLDANFTNRTVSAAVNIGISGQTWTGSASNMPIYRDQYFSAYSGTPIAGVPNPAPLSIGCTPSCGVGAAGSFDGFFTGRSGQRAGLLYNLGGNSGAIAFGRPGGG
jgi:hypothetical protein